MSKKDQQTIVKILLIVVTVILIINTETIVGVFKVFIFLFVISMIELTTAVREVKND